MLTEAQQKALAEFAGQPLSPMLTVGVDEVAAAAVAAEKALDEEQFDTLASLLKLMADPEKSAAQIERLKKAALDHRAAEAASIEAKSQAHQAHDAARAAASDAAARQRAVKEREAAAKKREDDLNRDITAHQGQVDAHRAEVAKLAGKQASHEQALKEFIQRQQAADAEDNRKRREADDLVRSAKAAHAEAEKARATALDLQKQAAAARDKAKSILAAVS